MTTREKIIVTATAIVVVWGGITYFRPPAAIESEDNDATVAAHHTFVERSRQQLAAARLTDTEQYVLETAQAEWQDRPPPRRNILQAVKPDQPQQIDFRYTGFLQTRNEYFAIINGHEYQVGDALRGAAGHVETIDPGQVVLALENGNKRVTIPLQRPVMKGAE